MRTTIKLSVRGYKGRGQELGLAFPCFVVTPKVSRTAFESNLKAKQNKTKPGALMSSHAL